MPPGLHWNLATDPDPGELTVGYLAEPTGVRLAGEASLADVARIRRVIMAFPANAEEIYLDLAGLDFIDVGAAREIIAMQRRPGQPRIILNDPPRALVQLLEVWPEDTSRITVRYSEPASSRRGRGSPGGNWSRRPRGRHRYDPR